MTIEQFGSCKLFVVTKTKKGWVAIHQDQRIYGKTLADIKASLSVWRV